MVDMCVQLCDDFKALSGLCGVHKHIFFEKLQGNAGVSTGSSLSIHKENNN